MLGRNSLVLANAETRCWTGVSMFVVSDVSMLAVDTGVGVEGGSVGSRACDGPTLNIFICSALFELLLTSKYAKICQWTIYSGLGDNLRMVSCLSKYPRGFLGDGFPLGSPTLARILISGGTSL